MRSSLFRSHCATAVMLCGLPLCLVPVPAPAQTAPPRNLTVTVGRGQLLQFNNDVHRVAVADPAVADAVVVSPREVMVNAKSIGRTTIVIWETAAIPVQYEVAVKRDTAEWDSLLQEIQESLPDAHISLTGNADKVVLTGTVKDAEQAKKAVALASTHTKDVVNLLQTPPPPEPRQILLQVKFASVNRTALSELGFNYFSRNDKTLGAISTEQFQPPRFSQFQFANQQFDNASINFADLLNLFAFRPDLNIGATIRALEGRNLLQILAEPNLIVVEGKQASFLAGGQFPFPTITATTTGGAVSPVITVQFKSFGVQLDFTPTVTPDGAIRLEVAPEVSALDFTNAVSLQGFLIPALSTRRAETEVILKDGESFAIAGLMDNRVVQVLNRIKGLGDIPIIGNLFRSRSVQKSADELLVLITPHFVRALAPGEKARLPDTVEPFLPTVQEQKAAEQAKHKNKKKDKEQELKPEFVGPRGHEEPK